MKKKKFFILLLRITFRFNFYMQCTDWKVHKLSALTGLLLHTTVQCSSNKSFMCTNSSLSLTPCLNFRIVLQSICVIFYIILFPTKKSEALNSHIYILNAWKNKSNNNSISHHQVCPIFSHIYTHSFCKRKKHLYKFFYNESKQKFVIIPFLTHQTLLPAAIGRHHRAFFILLYRAMHSINDGKIVWQCHTCEEKKTHGERAFYETARICRHR